MKKILFILICTLFTSTTTQAQSFLETLKKSFDKKDTEKIVGESVSESLTDIVTGLISKTPLNGMGIKGTWAYEAPYVAFESEDMLKSATSTLITQNIEKPFNTLLNKVGVTPETFTITFGDEQNATINIKGREISAQYTIDKATLTLTIHGKNFSMNMKQVGNTMQVSMAANNLYKFLNNIAEKAANISDNFATISQLISQYKGMYIGMQFSKKSNTKQ